MNAMSEELKPALTPEEWRECVEITRSGHDPLTYSILAGWDKAMCWINGNRSNHDPHKITRSDVDAIMAAASEWRAGTDAFDELAAIAAKLAALLPP